MLITALICMLLASITLAIVLCFLDKSKAAFLLAKTGALISLLCLGIVCASYKNNFSGFSLLLILSIAPMFLLLFDLSQISEKSQSDGRSKGFALLLENCPHFVMGTTFFLSALCLAFCGLYLGKETAFGFLFAIAAGFAATFIKLLITKNHKGKTFKQMALLFLDDVLAFTGVGLLLGAGCVCLTIVSVQSITFFLGVLAFAVHICLEMFFKNKYNHLVYFAAIILCLSTILF